MLAVWDLLGGFSGALRAVAGALVAFGLFSAWNVTFDNPRVTEAARREYVAIAQLEAANAKAAELERQLNVGAQAFEEYRKKLAAVTEQDAVDDARHEQEIADYEKKLAAAGRACSLDLDDLEWLRKP